MFKRINSDSAVAQRLHAAVLLERYMQSSALVLGTVHRACQDGSDLLYG